MMSTLSLRAVLELVDRVTTPLRSIDQQSRQVSQAFRQSNQALRNLERQMGDINSFRQLHQQIGATENAMQAQQQRCRSLAQQIRATNNPTAAMTREFERARREARQLTEQHRNQQAQLQGLRTRLQQAGVDTRNLGQHEQQLTSRIRAANAAMEQQRERLRQIEALTRRNTEAQRQYAAMQERVAKYRNIAMGAGIAGAVVDGAVIKTVKDFSSYEDAMLGLARQVPDMRDDNFKLTKSYHQLGNDLQSMSERLPMATIGLIALAEGGSRMGAVQADKTFDENRIALLKFTETIAGAAVAFDMQDQAGKLGEDMGRIASLYKLPINNINLMGDALNWLDDNAQSKGSDIIEVMNRMAGTATQVGMTWQDTAALGSTLLSLGATRETAGTAGTAMIRELAIAGMQPKSFQEGMNRLNLNSDQIQNSMSTDATGTILKVLEVINKLPKGEQATVTTQLFGKEFGDDAAKLAINIKEYRRQLKLTHDEQAKGSMGREMQARGETLSAQWQMMKNRLFNNSSDLGAGLQSSVSSVLGEINHLLDSINTWINKNPELAASIMKWVAVGGIALTVFSALALLFVFILGPIALLRLTLTVLNLRFLAASVSAGGFAATLLGRVVFGLWSALAGVGRLALGILNFLIPSFVAASVQAGRLVITMSMLALRTAGFMAMAAGSAIITFLSTMTMGFISASIGAWALMAPFVPLIVAVGLLVAAGLLIYQNWSTLAPVFKEMGLAFIDFVLTPFRGWVEILNLAIPLVNKILGTNFSQISFPTFSQPGALMAALQGTTPSASTVQTTQPANLKATTPALLRAPQPQQTVTNHFAASPITITGVTDPKAVGTEVQRQLAANQRQQAARQRSALSDTE
jgi:TP901 family phage tail tape measure protein